MTHRHPVAFFLQLLHPLVPGLPRLVILVLANFRRTEMSVEPGLMERIQRRFVVL